MTARELLVFTGLLSFCRTDCKKPQRYYRHARLKAYPYLIKFFLSSVIVLFQFHRQNSRSIVLRQIRYSCMRFRYSQLKQDVETFHFGRHDEFAKWEVQLFPAGQSL